MASLIVVHGFKPVLSRYLECVGVGKGGRTSPGLDARVSQGRCGCTISDKWYEAANIALVDLPRRNNNESFPLLRNSKICTTQYLAPYTEALRSEHVDYSIEVIFM